MRRRGAALVGLGIAVAGTAVLGGRVGVGRAPAVEAGRGEPPQVVATAVATTMDWDNTVAAMGDLRALNGADLSFEAAGVVDAIGFASGQDVARGAVLARLRLDDETARLAQLRAEADLAAINLARDQKQFAAQAVSHAIVDQDHATLLADQAQVAAEQALIAEKTLVAPFAGRLGVRQVDLGQYLQPGTRVVTLQALDPIAADFFVPQQDVGALRVGAAVQFTTDAFPRRRFTARVSAITPQVDQASRTVLVRAIVGNADRALIPGMFVNVTVATGAPTPRLTLPLAAIAFAPYGDTVFVLRRDAGGQEVARQVLVTTGPARGDQVAVLRGLAAGDVVVSAGQTKLHDGTPVVVDNTVTPAAGADPVLPEE
jgi:membrane fusion protein, multidrug efflux system